MYKRILWVILTLTVSHALWAQSGSIKGTAIDAVTAQALAGITVLLEETNQSTITDNTGIFSFQEVQAGQLTLVMLDALNEISRQTILLEAGQALELGQLRIEANEQSTDDVLVEIPVISLEGDEFEQGPSNNISGLLTASNDLFLQSTRFTWGTRRFRHRGLDSRNQQIIVNGVSVNDLEFGRPSFWLWSGLNDVTRSGVQSYGIVPMQYDFGGLIGGSQMDVRASAQWKQISGTLSFANLNYTQRAMLSGATGWMKNGWAFSAMFSRRWSQEGYAPGTFQDSYGYYAAASKKLNDKNQLHFTLMGAPNRRGGSGAAVQEMYDLAGTNYYNSFWGYQQGEKRNARVRHGHVPIAMLTHDFKGENGFMITTAVGYQNGTSGGTALDWFEANNPAPDYYRRLPSYVLDPELKDRVTAILQNDESLRQLNWDGFYQANSLNFQTIKNANGIPGNTVSGIQSQYIVEDRRYDTESLDFRTAVNVPLSENLKLQGGAAYRSQTKENFKLVEDLLGGDFYLDLDKFAVGDFTLDPNGVFNNLEQGNRIATVGDTIGYNYDTDIREVNAWAQLQGETKRLDYFLAAKVSNNRFWRTGNWTNGKFPDNSRGQSEIQNFFNYNLKGGVTVKFDGRNYLYLNGMTGTRAPFARNAFVAARVRNEVVPNLTNESLWGAELTYNFKSPGLKIRAGAYINEIKDQIETRGVFIDDGLQTTQGLFFGNYINSNIDSRHLGAEIATQVKITPSLSLNGTAAIGQYYYTDRMQIDVSIDNVAEFVIEDLTSYTKNFYVDGTPQTGYKLGLEYRAKTFWSLWVDVSYLDNMWLDFNTLRRTTNSIEYDNGSFVETDSELWNDILHQEKGNAGLFLDISFRKSHRFKDGNFLIGNISVNNVLNQQDYTSGGFEQLRFDFEGKDVDRFPPRLYYGFGRTFFLNLTYRFRY